MQLHCLCTKNAATHRNGLNLPLGVAARGWTIRLKPKLYVRTYFRETLPSLSEIANGKLAQSSVFSLSYFSVLLVQNVHKFTLLAKKSKYVMCKRQGKRFCFCCRHAGPSEDAHREDDHPGGGAVRYDRECQGEDPGQGRDPAGPAETHFRWSVELHRIPQPKGLNMPGGYLKRCPNLRRLSVLWASILHRCAWA